MEAFIRSLYELSDTCEFAPDIKNELIRDRVVVGILDKNLSEKMQLEKDLDLDKCVTMARNSKIVKGQVRVQMDGDVSRTDEIRRAVAKPKRSGPPLASKSGLSSPSKPAPGATTTKYRDLQSGENERQAMHKVQQVSSEGTMFSIREGVQEMRSYVTLCCML